MTRTNNKHKGIHMYDLKQDEITDYIVDVTLVTDRLTSSCYL